ncbi:MAG: phosphoribosylformylglycinamidine synthase, partial [Lachnospiraceae bacterium]|nr:phosphoribosylformylglycinamidine synthase [Lachnospiraceae bacterium]
GAVIAAAPAENVRREEPEPGDVVILLGGATGRDGIGGATGSSKAHDSHSVEKSGAEVQKGNAPEERKMQRLFKKGEATRMIKRCNDFGAGGVSVAIGELADGLSIDLDKVPKKYEGLDGTELAISESQERMAVVVAPEDAEKFIALSEKENLSATPVAVVTEEPRLVMHWKGKKILDLSRDFLNSNGAEKHIRVKANDPQPWQKEITGGFAENYRTVAEDLNICDRRGLSERFDSTVGGRTVLMPFGGKNQMTPIQAMVHRLPEDVKKTDDCSFMAWGFDPFISEKSPYHGAYLAVISSVAKLIATGADIKDTYLSFQEYFEKPGTDGTRWGKPLSALLGAFEAQMGLGIGAIGGKDSMSGSFEKLDVPPTLISFAVTMGKVNEVISPEFKDAEKCPHKVVQLLPEYDENGLPTTESFIRLCGQVTELMRAGKVLAAWTPTMGDVAEGVLKMCLGNGCGFRFNEGLTLQQIFGYSYGSFLLELAEGAEIPENAVSVGVTANDPAFIWDGETVSLEDLLGRYEGRLESVFANNIPDSGQPMTNFTYKAESWPVCSTKFAKPRVLIPAFPGTNCEMDSAHAIREAGGEPEVFVVRNYSAESIRSSVEEFAAKVKESQVIFIPGGFSGGDEPDGSGKFITAFFRNPAIKDGVTELLDRREGLMCGICNGFQALIKLGLVPYGRILDTDETMPTLTFNTIARHQSKIVRTRVASNKSPWLALADMDEIYNVAVSHGEGRFLASDEVVAKLAANGQICTQYVDLGGSATGEIRFNPNDSVYAIEGITSPDGRVLGKMGHNERFYPGLYRNVPGNYDMRMFEAAMKYFK